MHPLKNQAKNIFIYIMLPKDLGTEEFVRIKTSLDMVQKVNSNFLGVGSS